MRITAAARAAGSRLPGGGMPGL